MFSTKTPITIPIIVNVLSFFKAAWSVKKKKSHSHTHLLLRKIHFNKKKVHISFITIIHFLKSLTLKQM
jgi:DNA relaxase NicK